MCNAKLSMKHATAEWFELMWVRDRVVVSLSLSRNNMKLISYNYKSLMLPESSNIALCLSAAQSGDYFERGIWPGNVIRFALSQRGMFCFWVFFMFTVSQCHICSSRYQRGEEGWLWYSLQTCSQKNLAFLTDFFLVLIVTVYKMSLCHWLWFVIQCENLSQRCCWCTLNTTL